MAKLVFVRKPGGIVGRIAAEITLRILLIAIIAVGLSGLPGCSNESVEDPVNVSMALAPGVGDSVTITLTNGSQYRVTFESHTGNTWCYFVEEVAGSGPGGTPTDLSHWVLAIECHFTDLGGASIVSYSPDDGVPGTDGSTGTIGIKWNTDSSFSSGTFCITMDQDYAEAPIEVVVKAGNDFNSGVLPGPSCDPIIIHDQGGGE